MTRMNIRSHKVDIPTDSLADTPSGQVTLQGTLDLPTAGNQNIPYAIIAHCFTCNRNSLGASRLSKQLARLGVGSLRVDFCGLGQSGGSFSDSTLSTNVRDLECMAEWLAEHYSAPSLLVGHSLGGVAAIRAGSLIDSVKAVATVGAPFNPTHAADSVRAVVRQFSSDANLVEVTLPHRPLSLGRSFFTDLIASDPGADIARLGELDKALIIAHAPLDQTVGFEHARKIFAAAYQPASLLSLSNVDHLLTWPGSGQRVAELIWAQARQYVL